MPSKWKPNIYFPEADLDVLKSRCHLFSLQATTAIIELSSRYLKSEAIAFSEEDRFSKLYTLWIMSQKRNSKISKRDAKRIHGLAMVLHSFGHRGARRIPNQSPTAAIQLPLDKKPGASLYEDKALAETTTEDRHRSNFLEISKTNGEVYRSLIELLLSDLPKVRKEKEIANLIDKLPSVLKRIYLTMRQKILPELERNSSLMNDPTKGAGRDSPLLRGKPESNERYLLYILARARGMDEKQMAENNILDYARYCAVKEPYCGVIILELKGIETNKLREMGILGAGWGFCAVFHKEYNLPTFVVVPCEEQGSARNEFSVAMEEMKKHELHHLLWSMLTNAGAVRSIIEDEPLNNGFRRFRDEFVAHILNHGNIVATPREMVYSNDQQILEKAEELIGFASICIEIAKKKGMSADVFIYGIMISRNFEELAHNCFNVVWPPSKTFKEIRADAKNLPRTNYFPDFERVLEKHPEWYGAEI